MCEAMRHSCRTYELFEIARLILAKPERYVVVVKSIPDENDGTVPSLYISVPDGIPFEREEDAVGHVMTAHLDSFFETEVVDVEPPKGNFQYVCRCSITGELLAPPNYHRYAQILAQHHTTRLPDVPFERFKNAIETVKDAETVNAWVESMRKQTRYTFKEEVAGERPSFDSAAEARTFLLKHFRDRVVRAAKTARFSGTKVEELPEGRIRRSIEGLIEKQRRFPLETANGLRGRLRRQRFHIYKKGSHGVSYVCTVRRKFRQPDQIFSESVQELIRFLEDNPMIPASRLPEAHLGITATPENAESESADGESAAQPHPSGGGTSVPEDPRVKRMILDLRWLLTEGYVTEYSDGRLFVQPVVNAKSDSEGDDTESQINERESGADSASTETGPAAMETDGPGDSQPAPSDEAWETEEPTGTDPSAGAEESARTTPPRDDDAVSTFEKTERNLDTPKADQS